MSNNNSPPPEEHEPDTTNGSPTPTTQERAASIEWTNPLIPTEPHRLREPSGQITPPPIELRPLSEDEKQALLEAPTEQGAPKRKQKMHIDFTDELKVKFINLYAQYGVKFKCAKACGITPYAVTRHEKTDPDFKEAVEWARLVFCDSIEETIIDRAIHGWDEPVYSQRLGTQIGSIRRFDNKLLELLAKRHIAAFRDKQQVDVNVTGGVLVAPSSPAEPQEWANKFKKPVATDRVEPTDPDPETIIIEADTAQEPSTPTDTPTDTPPSTPTPTEE